MKGFLTPVPAATLDAIEAECPNVDTITVGSAVLAALVAEVKLRRAQQAQRSEQNAHIKGELHVITVNPAA